MPHQCTNCGRRFPDGSKEMLSGCPECGGNRFQFTPDGSIDEGADEETGEPAETGEGDEPVDDEDGTVSRAAATVRDWMSESGADESPSDADPEEGPDRPVETEAAETDEDPFAEWPETARPPEDGANGSPADEHDEDREVEADWPDPPGEDSAQADARRTVVEPDELPEEPESTAPDDRPDHGRVVSEPDEDDQPSVDELRNELNEQFESIKIVEPGQYELNLMELYDREEHIVSLQEDGRYVIDVPDSWVDADE